jgi:arsenic resistance protein ArsH
MQWTESQAVMQVSGSSLPSAPKVLLEFDEHNRMKPSALYDRVVDVMEELVKFMLLLRDRADPVDRYSERWETARELSGRVNQRGI